jgi:hypothetical protein
MRPEGELEIPMRDVESLCEQAGLGELSRSSASRMCEELKERFEQFQSRSPYDVKWWAAGPEQIRTL